jgi:hypothetical protein
MEGRNSSKLAIYSLFAPTASCDVLRILRRFTGSVFLWCSSIGAAANNAGPLMERVAAGRLARWQGMDAILTR